MKSELAQKLKILLDNMSQEEFDKDWDKIVALNLPSNFEQVIKNRIEELKRDTFIDETLKKRLIKENNLIFKKCKL